MTALSEYLRRLWVLSALLLGLHAVSLGQSNLVYNPSFEEHTLCPERIDAIGIMRGVDGWWQPTAGSSDYFNPCGGRECLVPRNKMGNQAAHTGEAYCGIYCSKEDYREYLQTELREPLRRGCTSFWVSLADKSPYSVATLGMLFSQERLEDSTWNILRRREVVHLEGGEEQVISSECAPQVGGTIERQLDDTRQWVQIAGEFVAEGGERFLTLGNFATFNRSSVVETGMPNAVLPGAYYYIDDVEVVCLQCPEQHPSLQSDTLSIGQTFTLQNILFDTDKSELLPPSYAELQKLLSLLRKHPTMRIEVQGHTDDQGTAEHNRILSEQRAQAVVQYLVGNGIDASRLEWHGYGKSLPIDSNLTPEGRRHNRRVECRILQL